MTSRTVGASPIRFDDADAYEQMMGVWSRLVGSAFLDWLKPRDNLRWIDIGCGNGAFCALLLNRCAPAFTQGIDPSDAQLAFARTRFDTHVTAFERGDAQALRFDADTFDAAVMALVIFFLSDPAKGVAEMRRVVRPGGIVGAYAWDVLNDGSPIDPIRRAMIELGIEPPSTPSRNASPSVILAQLWTKAGLENVETKEIYVERTFNDFENFWRITIAGSILQPTLAALPDRDIQTLKDRLRSRLVEDTWGRITYGARANAVKGRTPFAKIP